MFKIWKVRGKSPRDGSGQKSADFYPFRIFTPLLRTFAPFVLFILFRNYKRLTKRKPVTEDMLEIARQRRRQGESIRRIAGDFEIDKSTLRKRLKKGCGVTSLGRFKSTFNPDQETQLAEHCRQMDARFYGIVKKSFRLLAYQFAVQNNITHNFNEQTQLAGEDWAQSFLKRHNLTLRIPQKQALGEEWVLIKHKY